MIRLKNNTAKPMQFDSRILHPGMTLSYPDEIASYSAVQRDIRSGKISVIEDAS